jgi:hypothetical protein
MVGREQKGGDVLVGEVVEQVSWTLNCIEMRLDRSNLAVVGF